MRTTLVTLLLCACGTGVSPVAVPTPGPARPASEAPLTAACAFDAPASEARGALVAATSSDAFVVRSDGSHATLFTAANEQTWLSDPQARGNFIALVVSELVQNQYATHLELFDRDGHRLATVDPASQGYLSSHGIFAMWAESGMTLVLADGSQKAVPDLTPAGDFGPGATLPVWTKERDLALYDVETGVTTPLAIPLSGWSSPIWSGDTLVYIGQGDGSPVLVRQTGATTQTTPFTTSLENQGLAVEQLAGSTAILVTGSWVQIRTKLDLETGAVTPFEVTVPDGATFAGRHSPSLADDGALVAAFTRDGAAGLYRSTDGVQWTAMGSTVKGAGFVQFAGKRGSWVMAASGGLQAGTAATLGLIPAMGLSQRLPVVVSNEALSPDALSADARCAAVWTKSSDGFSLVASDLVTGAQHTVAVARGMTPPRSATWLSR